MNDDPRAQLITQIAFLDHDFEVFAVKNFQDHGFDINRLRFGLLKQIHETQTVNLAIAKMCNDMTSQAIYRHVNWIVEEGFATKTTNPDDARAYELALTDAGSDALVKCERILLDSLSTYFRNLTEDEIVTLLSLARKIKPFDFAFFDVVPE